MVSPSRTMPTAGSEETTKMRFTALAAGLVVASLAITERATAQGIGGPYDGANFRTFSSPGAALTDSTIQQSINQHMYGTIPASPPTQTVTPSWPTSASQAAQVRAR